MPRVYYGTKNEPGFDLEQSNDLIAVRTRSGRSVKSAVGPVPTPLSAELSDGALVVAFPTPASKCTGSRSARRAKPRSAQVRAAGLA